MRHKAEMVNITKSTFITPLVTYGLRRRERVHTHTHANKVISTNQLTPGLKNWVPFIPLSCKILLFSHSYLKLWDTYPKFKIIFGGMIIVLV